MPEFDLRQKNRLGLIPIAVGEVVIGAVQNRLLYIPASATRISALIPMIPDGPPQHRRPLGQQPLEPVPLIQQGLI